jgi:hypothetical protein
LWLQGLGILAEDNLGILALLGPNSVGFNQENGIKKLSDYDPIILYLCALTSQIRGTGRKIAIGIPPHARYLPLLLAATSVLAGTLDKFCKDPEVASADGVLVISPDLVLRSAYCDLMVGHVTLDEAHHGSRMLPDGRRFFLRNYPVSASVESLPQGVCFFLPQLQLPNKVDFQPATVIDDLRYARWVRRAGDQTTWIKEKFPAAGGLALYTTGDVETLEALVKSGFEGFPIDHAAIQSCLEYVPGHLPRYDEGEITNIVLFNAPSSLERNHSVVLIQTGEKEENLFLSIRRIIDSQDRNDSPGLNRARWLLAALSQIPVPLIWYEEASRSLGRSTIRRLIDRLDARNHADTIDAAIMQTLRVQFQQLYALLEHENPRVESLRITILQKHANRSDGEVLLLVRDRVCERAVRNWLTLEAFPREAWLNCIDVKCCPEYADIADHQYPVAIICGAFPRRYRWIPAGALGAQTIFLAYSHEIGAIKGQLQAVYGKYALSNRSKKRNDFMLDILSTLATSTCGQESSITELKLECPEITPLTACRDERSEKTAAASAQELADIMTERSRIKTEEDMHQQSGTDIWEDDIGDEVLDENDDALSHTPHSDDVECITMRVVSRSQGSCRIRLGKNTVAEVVQAQRPTEVVRLLPNEIHPGDVLLIIDEGIRGDLFDRVVDLAEQQPRLRYLASYRRAWRDAIQLLASQFRCSGVIDYSCMLSQLQTAGAPVQTEAALRGWVYEQVIGPEALGSIRAVGVVSGNQMIVKQANDFDKAFHKIRGIRTSIGRLINAAIRQTFTSFGDIGETGMHKLDDRLLLPVNELIETLDFAEVVLVESESVMVAPQAVGMLNKLNEE